MICIDFFNEHIIKRKKTLNDKLLAFGYIIAAIVVNIALAMFAAQLSSLFILLIVGVWYGTMYMVNSLNVEFEYSLTNGDLDIDKIVAQKRRKRVLSINAKDIEYFAPYNNDYKKQANNPELTKIDASISLDIPGVYFAIFNNNSKRTVLYFNPTEKMLEGLFKTIPRTAYHK